MVIFCLMALSLSNPSVANDDGFTAALIAPLAQNSLLLDGADCPAARLAVGDRGHILRKTASVEGWQQMPVPVDVMLTGVACNRQGVAIAVGHSGVILRSPDSGQSWSLVNGAADLNDPYLHVSFISTNTVLALGSYGMADRSLDGGKTWEAVFISEEEPHFYDMARLPDGRIMAVGEFGSIMEKRPDQEEWVALPSPYDGTLFGVHALDNGTLVVFGIQGNVFISPDNGQSWHRPKIDGKAQASGASLFAANQLPDGRVLIAGASGQILLSHDASVESFSLTHMPGRDTYTAFLPFSDQSDAIVLLGDKGFHHVTLGSLAP